MKKVFIIGIAVMLGIGLLNQETQAAGNPKISYKKITLQVGKSKTIRLKNIKRGRRLKWKSTNRKVARVSRQGRITAKRPGRANIYTVYGKKKYSCKVQVKKRNIAKAAAEVKVQIGMRIFKVLLNDNAAAAEFRKMLPLTINMDDLNGNEKYAYLNKNFTTGSEAVKQIRNGDLMLYGDSCLVIFYKSFPTSYRYTRLGYIEDPAGLAAALGTGAIKVTFGK